MRLSQPLTLAETKGFIGERFDDGAGLQYLNARYYDPRLGMFVQPDWWEVTSPGVGTNRYSYSFNDPVNGRDPGGHAKLGSSFDGHDDEAEKAKKAAEDDRKALLDAAEKARKAKEALLKGKKLGFLDGLLGFGNRITKSYGIDPVRGTPSVETLGRFASMADAAASRIDIPGRGIVLEHIGLAEADIRKANPGFTDTQVEAEMVARFGITKFKFNGTTTGFVGRPAAAAWSAYNSGRVLLDNQFNGQRGVISHEVGHEALGLHDFHDLDGNGYGRKGIAAALDAGLQWENADSFACVASLRC